MNKDSNTFDFKKNKDGHYEMRKQWSLAAIGKKAVEHPVHTLGLLASAGSLALMASFAIDLEKETSTPSFAPELTTPATPESDSTLAKQRLLFEFDDDGFQRGTTDFAFNLACQNADERYKIFCEAAFRNQHITGMDASIMMYKIGMETGFTDYTGDTKRAQGPLQIQPGYLVSELFTHGRDLPIYQESAMDSPIRLAIDHLLNDQAAFKNQRARANRIHTQFVKSMREGNERIEFEHEHDRTLSDLRFNMDFAMQLVSLVSMEHVPATHTSNFTQSWDADYAARKDAALRAYSVHNMGANGAQYQMALINNPDHRTLMPIDTDKMDSALSELRTENSWPLFSASAAQNNAKANPSVFGMGEQTYYGCALYDMDRSMDAKMGGFIDSFETAMTISSQSFEDFQTSGVNLVDTYFNPFPSVEKSPAPKARPDNLTVSATQDVIIDSPQTWEDLNCNVQVALRVSPRPPQRSDNLGATNEPTASGLVTTSPYPVARSASVTIALAHK